MNYSLSPRSNCPMCLSSIEQSVFFGERLAFSAGLKVRKGMGNGLRVLKCKNCGLLYPAERIFFKEDHYRAPFSGNFPPYDSIPYQGSFISEMKMLAGIS